MKTLFFLVAAFISLALNAQVTKVSIQASGLTCSMCSNSINKALKAIDFVDKIDADIKTSTFNITFKPGSNVDFNKLKKKVEDAGFFVSKFIVTIHFDNVQIKENEPVVIDNKTFQFINSKDNVLNGDKDVQILDKGFVSSKEFKKLGIAAETKAEKIYHAQINPETSGS